jgi:phenylalanyl-tRNA synthetase beta chain
MLNIFLGQKPLPNYQLVPPCQGELEKIIVKEDVSWNIRKNAIR